MARRGVSSILALFIGLSSLALLAPASAQGDGDPLCDAALTASNAGATTWKGYRIVIAPAQGGNGAQVVLGTDTDDVLDGGSGNDLLCGFNGSDTLSGGSGNDILVGGPGLDALYGESGGDTLYGTVGELLNGGTGNNRIRVDTQPQPQPSVVLTLDQVGTTCTLSVAVSGFAPGTYDVLLDVASGLDRYPFGQVTVGADGSGASVLGRRGSGDGTPFFAEVAGVSSEAILLFGCV